MQAFAQSGSDILHEATRRLEEAADKLKSPDVYALARRSALNMTAAVAVDAGQSLFGGVLHDAGIAVFQVASSEEGDEPRTYPFWVAPNLPENEKEAVVRERLGALVESDTILRDFVDAINWIPLHQHGLMPPQCYESAAALSNFVRELLEWATLYHLSRRLKTVKEQAVGIQPILLRDGTLRFDNMGERHANDLRELFRNLGIPILGVTKQSALLRSPVIVLWLSQHGVFSTSGPLVVKLDPEDFEKLGWRLERYFGTPAVGEEGEEGKRMRFGQYALARFDPMPGSRNLLAVDVPDYLIDNWDDVLVLLSGLAEHATATAYPAPGYPVALRKAHDKVVLTPDKVRLLENAIRRTVPPAAYDLLKLLGM